MPPSPEERFSAPQRYHFSQKVLSKIHVKRSRPSSHFLETIKISWFQIQGLGSSGISPKRPIKTIGYCSSTIDPGLLSQPINQKLMTLQAPLFANRIQSRPTNEHDSILGCFECLQVDKNRPITRGLLLRPLPKGLGQNARAKTSLLGGEEVNDLSNGNRLACRPPVKEGLQTFRMGTCNLINYVLRSLD